MNKNTEINDVCDIFREYKVQSIDILLDYEQNARDHSQAQIEEIVKSIKEFGYTSPILVDENNRIIAGHCRVEAARRVGLKNISTIIIDDLSDVQKAALVIADNKMALNSSWNYEKLSNQISFLKENQFDLSLTGFSVEEIDEFMPDSILSLQCDEDEIPNSSHETITKIGDVWKMGNHRLMCGDATNIDTVEILMNGEKSDMVFTDPPYNTGMTSESQRGAGGLWKGKRNVNKSKKLSHMFDDNFSDSKWKEFLSSMVTTYWIVMKDDTVAYICFDWRRNHELINQIEISGFKRSNLIVWDKMVHGLGSDYKYTHEFINVCKKGKPNLRTHQGEDREYSDIWHIQRKMGKNEEHATAKPVVLIERAINHATRKNDLVLDLFGGSGSTLIACEKTNRKCFMMEIIPSYCDVIVARWERITGKKAILESL